MRLFHILLLPDHTECMVRALEAFVRNLRADKRDSSTLRSFDELRIQDELRKGSAAHVVILSEAWRSRRIWFQPNQAMLALSIVEGAQPDTSRCPS